jgi:hypothetical protein
MLAARVSRQPGDDLRELRIVRRERERRAISHQRFRHIATATGNVGQTANCREVVGSASEDALELGLRLVESIERSQRACQRHARRHVAGMRAQAGAAGLNRFLHLPGAAELFRQLCESDGRRVACDPTSEAVNPWRIAHCFEKAVLSARRSYGCGLLRRMPGARRFRVFWPSR